MSKAGSRRPPSTGATIPSRGRSSPSSPLPPVIPPPAIAQNVEEKSQSFSHTMPVNSESEAANNIKSKLAVLSDRFTGFEAELNLSKSKKKSEDDKRIIVLQTQLNNLQQSLALESKNRALSVKALQAWLTDRIAQWTEQIEAPMHAKIEALNGRVTELTSRLEDLERQHQEDRITFPKLVDARCEQLLVEIKELKNRFEANTLQREEKEKRILLKVQDQGNKLTAQLAAEKTITDDKIAQVRKDLEDEIAIRTKGHELLRLSLMEDVALLRADISKERAERIHADEDLVQAINHYAAALQDGIKIVSSQ